MGFNEKKWGGSRYDTQLLVQLNFDPKFAGWRTDAAIYFGLRSDCGCLSLDLEQAKEVRDHLSALIDEIEKNLSSPAKLAKVGTVLKRKGFSWTLTKYSGDKWIASISGTNYTNDEVAELWDEFEEVE